VACSFAMTMGGPPLWATLTRCLNSSIAAERSLV
jgi:hypothetical protein